MNYEMGGTILSTTVKEKDLGVTMNANMKVSEQCRIAASKAYLPTLMGYPRVSQVFTLFTVPRLWQQLLTGLFLPHGFIFTSTLANNYCREHVLAA